MGAAARAQPPTADRSTLAFGSRSKLPAWLLGTMLSLANASAVADEFADVDPERLAKGVEILAAKWSIPAVVFQGATDDFCPA